MYVISSLNALHNPEMSTFLIVLFMNFGKIKTDLKVDNPGFRTPNNVHSWRLIDIIG